MQLQFFAQGIAINAQDFRRLRLVATSTHHDSLQDGFFNDSNHHVIHIGSMLLTQIMKILFQTLLDNGLYAFFTHVVRITELKTKTNQKLNAQLNEN